MNHPTDIDAFLEQLPPMFDAEKAEIVLGYLNVELREMTSETLRIFRARCLEMQSGEHDQTVVLEVIDRMLALREMDGVEAEEHVQALNG